MALNRRGLRGNENLATNVAAITASGLEAVVSAPAYLYSVTVSEGLRAANVFVKVADASASGSSARLTVAISSALGDGTKQVVFNPPLYFASGIFCSSTGTNLGTATFQYMD